MIKEEVLDEVNVVYERVRNNENNLFSDGNYTEALEVLIDYYEVGFIEELEKIKENIQFIAEKCLPNNLAEEFEVKGLKTSIEIIDRRISELKGENK